MRYCDRCGAAFQWMRTCPRDGVPTRGDVDDPLIGNVVGERYRVLERLGAGGMGQVYRAVHVRIPSVYAVKVLFGDVAHDPEMRGRFEREAEVASLLQSRHIVRVMDFGETPAGLLYLVMEHLDGRDLADHISRAGRFTPERAVAITRQIARGISHAHERGVVHRDLKPENAMLVTEDEEPDVVKLLDFGLARLREAPGNARLTRAGQVFGTPMYMAPEQFADSAAVDARADLYALGVILYELLTGSTPFGGSSLSEIAANVVTTPAPSLGNVAGVTPALATIVQTLLAKSPDQRFASARALIQALSAPAVLGGESRATTVSNPPPPPAMAIPVGVTNAISEALVLGAPTYNRGDHAGCAEIYRETAEELLAGELHVGARTAAGARMVTAIRRATAASDATRAAWELRFAFDDVLAVADQPAAIGPSTASSEVALAGRIAAPRYAAGELDLVAEYYLDVAELLAARLRREGGTRADIAMLDEAVAQARGERAGAARALSALASAFDAIRAGRSHAPTQRAQGSAVVAKLAASSAIFDVATRIVEAIGLGVPAYNSGDVAGCARVYKHAAQAIVTSLAKDPASLPLSRFLNAALEGSAGLDDDGVAWTLRRAFDTVLEARASKNA